MLTVHSVENNDCSQGFLGLRHVRTERQVYAVCDMYLCTRQDWLEYIVRLGTHPVEEI